VKTKKGKADSILASAKKYKKPAVFEEALKETYPVGHTQPEEPSSPRCASKGTVANMDLSDRLYIGRGTADTVLIKGTWFVQQFEHLTSGNHSWFPLPNRQSLEASDGKFATCSARRRTWDPVDLQTRLHGWNNPHPAEKINKHGSPLDIHSDLIYAPIVALSHWWRAADHPDPGGLTLFLLGRIAQWVLKRLELKRFNTHGGDFALFMDWCSLFQTPRNDDQKNRFTRSLNDVHIWYTHKMTTTWFLAQTEAIEDVTTYHVRGWPFFERAVASLLKGEDMLLEIDEAPLPAHISVVITARIKDGSNFFREPPPTPEAFSRRLRDKVFTHAHDGPVVDGLYCKIFEDVMLAATELKYSSIGWRSTDVKTLSLCFSWCASLEELYLDNNKITYVRDGTFQGLRSLTKLDLSSNRLRHFGVDTIPGASLKSLNLDDNPDLKHSGVYGIQKHFPGLAVRHGLTCGSIAGLKWAPKDQSWSPVQMKAWACRTIEAAGSKVLNGIKLRDALDFVDASWTTAHCNIAETHSAIMFDTVDTMEEELEKFFLHTEEDANKKSGMSKAPVLVGDNYVIPGDSYQERERARLCFTEMIHRAVWPLESRFVSVHVAGKQVQIASEGNFSMTPARR